MKGSGAGGNLNYGVLAQDILEEKKFNMLPRDYSCDILVKNMNAFAFVLRVCLRLISHTYKGPVKRN